MSTQMDLTITSIREIIILITTIATNWHKRYPDTRTIIVSVIIISLRAARVLRSGVTYRRPLVHAVYRSVPTSIVPISMAWTHHTRNQRVPRSQHPSRPQTGKVVSWPRESISLAFLLSIFTPLPHCNTNLHIALHISLHLLCCAVWIVCLTLSNLTHWNFSALLSLPFLTIIMVSRVFPFFWFLLWFG